MDMEANTPGTESDIFKDRRAGERRKKNTLFNAIVNNQRSHRHDRRQAYNAMKGKPWWLKRDYVDFETTSDTPIDPPSPARH